MYGFFSGGILISIPGITPPVSRRTLTKANVTQFGVPSKFSRSSKLCLGSLRLFLANFDCNPMIRELSLFIFIWDNLRWTDLHPFGRPGLCYLIWMFPTPPGVSSYGNYPLFLKSGNTWESILPQKRKWNYPDVLPRFLTLLFSRCQDDVFRSRLYWGSTYLL